MHRPAVYSAAPSAPSASPEAPHAPQLVARQPAALNVTADHQRAGLLVLAAVNGPRPAVLSRGATVALACSVAMAWSPDAVRSPHQTPCSGRSCSSVRPRSAGERSTTFGRTAMIEIDFKTGTALRYLIGHVCDLRAVAALGGSVSGRLQWQVLAGPSTLKTDGGASGRRGHHLTFLSTSRDSHGLELRSQRSPRWRRPLRRSSSPGACWRRTRDRGRSSAGVLLLLSVFFINRAVETRAVETRGAPVRT